MAPTIVGVSSTATWTGGTAVVGCTFSADLPAGVASGHLLILPVFARTTAVTIDLTATYDLVSGADQDNGASVAEVQAKIAGVAEADPSVHTTVESTQPSGAIVVAIQDWSGDLADLIIATDTGTNTTPTAPTATPDTNDSLVMRFFMQTDDNTVTTGPSGHTQEFYESTLQGSDAMMAAYSQDAAGQAGVGVGTAVLTMSGSDPWRTYTLIIPPTAGVTGVVAGEIEGPAGELTGTGSVSGVIAGEIEGPAGDLAGTGAASGVLAGQIEGPAGELTGTVVSGAAGVVAGEIEGPAGALAGAGSCVGILDGTLPELVGPLLGTVVGGVTRRLKALPTTTVSIYAPASIDEWSGDRATDTLVETGVIASIIEQTRTTNDPRTGTSRTVRNVAGRVPDGTEVSKTSRVVDAEGRTYAVAEVRQIRNPVWIGDIFLDLVRTDQQAT